MVCVPQARAVAVNYLVTVAKVDVFAEDMEGQAAVDIARAGGYAEVESWLVGRMGEWAQFTCIPRDGLHDSVGEIDRIYRIYRILHDGCRAGASAKPRVIGHSLGHQDEDN